MNASQRHRWTVAHLIERASHNGAVESALLAILVLGLFLGASHVGS